MLGGGGFAWTEAAAASCKYETNIMDRCQHVAGYISLAVMLHWSQYMMNSWYKALMAHTM